MAASALAACGAALEPRSVLAAGPGALIQKRIPSSGESLPIVGLGTNNYSVSEPGDLAPRRRVIERFVELGGRVIDTAPAYGRSEVVVGDLVGELGKRDEIFLATKVTAPGDDVGAARLMIEQSFVRLRSERIDLLQVHNLDNATRLLPMLAELKRQERIRYFGITTSRTEQHDEMAQLMRAHPIDFIQVDYSIDNTAAADTVLPLAADRGIAVLVNMPFGGRREGNLFQRVHRDALPEWAIDAGIDSWAQFFLKFVVSHPAVTCAIPGTHRVEHLEDNIAAARGMLPDAPLRTRMAAYWDAL
jgi:aryl-alcohol dehydrogenase-like predicted oxidoreductase